MHNKNQKIIGTVLTIVLSMIVAAVVLLLCAKAITAGAGLMHNAEYADDQARTDARYSTMPPLPQESAADTEMDQETLVTVPIYSTPEDLAETVTGTTPPPDAPIE